MATPAAPPPVALPVDAAVPLPKSSGGVVLFAGSVAHSMTGRSAPSAGFDGVEATNLSRFHRIAALEHVSVTAVVASPTAAHFAAIDAEQRLWVWGRNERGQLGTGSTKNVYVPQPSKELVGVVSAAVGRSHSLAATADGSVWGTGEGAKGQLGVGKAPPAPLTVWTKTKPFLPAGRTVTALACGGDFSLALDNAGALYVCGSEEYGQCGTGRTGERIIAAGKVGYDSIETFTLVAALAGEKITAIAAGTNHAVALTEDGQVFTWGCAGYGRLGHGSAADELSPRCEGGGVGGGGEVFIRGAAPPADSSATNLPVPVFVVQACEAFRARAHSRLVC
jgi:alpha-tubulin suppressor-like RCC1 family protein